MDKIRVTKRGRPRKYQSDAERQRAYRQRQAKKEAEEDARWHPYQRKLDPNRIINEIVETLYYAFSGQELLRACKQGPDRERVPEWIASLQETRRNLNRFIRFLKKL